MKIISKFTDFYEYDCYRYGEPDKSLVWVRDTIEKKRNKAEDAVKNVRSKYFLAGKATDGQYINPKSGILITNIYINQILIGIYPYVYWYPKISWVVGFSEMFMSIEDSIKCLTIPGYYVKCFAKYDISLKNVFIPKQILNAGKIILSHRNDGRNIKDPFIVEDPSIFSSDIFNTNEPVFEIYDGCMDYVNVTTNPWLNKTSILSIYANELSQRDIYNDIENYIWSKKQKPISEPDNKTKILAHGFDTKTSFRKM